MIGHLFSAYRNKKIWMLPGLHFPYPPSSPSSPPFFFSFLIHKEVVRQGEISHLSETHPIKQKDM